MAKQDFSGSEAEAGSAGIWGAGERGSKRYTSKIRNAFTGKMLLFYVSLTVVAILLLIAFNRMSAAHRMWCRLAREFDGRKNAEGEIVSVMAPLSALFVKTSRVPRHLYEVGCKSH